MKLESILFRNIGPFGNKIVEVNLMDNGGLWLVTGRNGHGKSTLLNIPKALFYGKVDKLKKDEIANRFNKYGMITGNVRGQDGALYRIERKFSPSSLSVSKDVVDLDIAGISNAQNFIDNEITMMPYQIYSNIVSLSINDFKSFLSMTAKDKREIVDRIFSMDIINDMNVLLKNDIRNVRLNIDLLDREAITIKQSIDNYVIKLEESKASKENELRERIESINSEIATNDSKLLEYYNSLNIIQDKINTIDVYLKKINDVKYNYNFKINKTSEEISLYNSGLCPTCNTNLNSETHTKHKEELELLLCNMQKDLKAVNDKENEAIDKRNKISQAIDTLSTTINNIKNRNENLKYELDISVTNMGTNDEHLSSIISDENIRLRGVESEKEAKMCELSDLAILESMYGNDGIKQTIVESYLPFLNKEISSTLEYLHFPYNVEFDRDFEPIINHLGVNISQDTLSTGERKRVDLAVLVSIIRLMKRKYPHLNMFMLDEVLASIDQDGISDIIHFMRETAKDLHINIFIVNHSPLPVEYFDRIMYIDKVDSFSEINIDVIE